MDIKVETGRENKPFWLEQIKIKSMPQLDQKSSDTGTNYPR